MRGRSCGESVAASMRNAVLCMAAVATWHTVLQRCRTAAVLRARSPHENGRRKVERSEGRFLKPSEGASPTSLRTCRNRLAARLGSPWRVGVARACSAQHVATGRLVSQLTTGRCQVHDIFIQSVVTPLDDARVLYPPTSAPGLRTQHLAGNDWRRHWAALYGHWEACGLASRSTRLIAAAMDASWLT